MNVSLFRDGPGPTFPRPSPDLPPGVPAGGIHVSEIDPRSGCLLNSQFNGKDGG
jgi:hypothetical protein